MTGPLRWYQIIRNGEFLQYVLADRFELGEVWVTFTAEQLQVAAFLAEEVESVVDCAAMLTEPPELKASDAARKTSRKETR